MRTVPSLLLLLPVVLWIGACESPCQQAWDRLYRCAKTPTEKKIYRPKAVGQLFREQCKKQDPDRIKRCLNKKGCAPFRQRLAKAAAPRYSGSQAKP